VKQGELVEPKQRFVKEYMKQFALVIEPEPANVNAVMAMYPNLLLMTRNQLITKQSANRNTAAEIKTYNLENRSFAITPVPQGFKVTLEQKQFDIMPQTINRWLNIIGVCVFPLLLLFWFSVYCFTKPLHVFIFSIVSLIISACFKRKFSYSQLWNIGVYALVPATCLAVVLDILGLRLPFFPLVYCLTYAGYLYAALKAACNADEQAGKNT